MTIGFQPTGDNVLLHLVAAEDAGLNDTVEWAEVIAVGPGRYTADGMLMPPDLAPGDKVALRPHAAVHLRIDGQPLAIAGGADVLGVLLPQAPRPRAVPEPGEPGQPAEAERQSRGIPSLEVDVAPDLLNHETPTAEDLH